MMPPEVKMVFSGFEVGERGYLIISVVNFCTIEKCNIRQMMLACAINCTYTHNIYTISTLF